MSSPVRSRSHSRPRFPASQFPAFAFWPVFWYYSEVLSKWCFSTLIRSNGENLVMRKLIAALSLLALVGTGRAETIDPTLFTHRAPVTFPTYNLKSTLENFPVLVRLTSAEPTRFSRQPTASPVSLRRLSRPSRRGAFPRSMCARLSRRRASRSKFTTHLRFLSPAGKCA